MHLLGPRDLRSEKSLESRPSLSVPDPPLRLASEVDEELDSVVVEAVGEVISFSTLRRMDHDLESRNLSLSSDFVLVIVLKLLLALLFLLSSWLLEKAKRKRFVIINAAKQEHGESTKYEGSFVSIIMQ